MIQRSLFFIVALAFGLVSCDATGSETKEDKYQEASKALRGLVSKYCSASDKITLSIKGEIVDLPCGYRQHIKLFHDSGEVNYQKLSYIEGLEPIPINSIQLMVENPDELKKIWDVTPPAGVVINIYSLSAPKKLKQDCEDYIDPKRSYCRHYYIPISGTKLSASLRFNADSVSAYSFSKKTITQSDFPYAYYPEVKWPELYQETESFVKSLVVENK